MSSLCANSVTTVIALLFECHLCHVATCLQPELSSTEEKLSQRFLHNPHTRSLTDGCTYLSCVCIGMLVLNIMSLLDVA